MSNAEVVGAIVISKKGHDKGAYYVITSVIDDKFVFAVNGENRQVATPKRKNICHLSITGRRVAAIDDRSIKDAIRKHRANETDGAPKLK